MYQERRHQKRTEASVNALLLSGDKIPLGCRTHDVSPNGMQLQWGAHDWSPDFGEGEPVDIHISLRQSEGRKKLVKPAIVKWVGDGHVGVEFEHPEPRLLTLLDSYRVGRGGRNGSPAHAQGQGQSNAGVRHADGEMPRPSSIPSSAVAEDAVSPDLRGAPATGIISERGEITGGDVEGSAAGAGDGAGGGWKKSVLPAVLASLVVVVLVAAAAILLAQHVDRELTDLRSTLDRLSARLDASERRSARVANLESTLSYLTARTDRLHQAVVDLRLGPSAAADTGEASPKVPNGGAKAVPAITEGESVPRVGRSTEAVAAPSVPSRQLQPPTAPPAPESAAAAGSEASWEIVLMSLRSEASADRVIAKGRSLQIPVRKYRTESGAKGFWRLGVPGFASLEAARAYAEKVKPMLGLSNVWIVRD